MAKKAAKGWTHPRHWFVMAIGTVLEILAAVFIIIGLVVVPIFSDSRRENIEYTLINGDVQCATDYCINIKDYDETLKATFKEEGWYNAALALIIVGGGSNLVSLLLQVAVFWPFVMLGKVLNIVLHVCRLVDFFLGILKFFGTVMLIGAITDVNQNFGWRRKDKCLMMNTLPIACVLFSYILQTLCFVCTTLATDKGARGQESHWKTLAGTEDEEEEEDTSLYRKVSYNPVDTTRSSKVLANVEKYSQSGSQHSQFIADA